MPTHNDGPTKRPKAQFRAGDKVRVVSEPYWRCPFNWVDDMTKFCGQEVTILSVDWASSKQTYLYRIAEARVRLAWCKDCFVPVEEDLPEADADMTLLLS